ncbi:MAG: hypothetical protein PHF37_05445 [Phycisphaerae bacterium]|nr:hypothetical protein [Phycisphaerae bacterium]
MAKANLFSGWKAARMLSIVLVSTIFLIPLTFCGESKAENNDVEKQKIVRQVAENLIEAGTRQYERGYYKQAERSFLQAKSYEQYLDSDTRTKIDELLVRTRAASGAAVRGEEQLGIADQFIAQERWLAANTQLELILENQFLTDEQLKAAREKKAVVDVKVAENKQQVAQIYNNSIDLYNQGQYQQALEGFQQIADNPFLVAPEGQNAKDYIARINAELNRPAEPVVQPEPVMNIEDQLLTDETPQEPQPQAEEGNYLSTVNRRIEIIRGMARAVVNDAVEKAQAFIGEQKFDQADAVIASALRTVNENQIQLGEDLYNYYSAQLRQVSGQIADARQTRLEQIDQERIAEATRAQENFRQQMEIERQRRINELMENALTFKKQQRYQEALGQVNSLIAIDPQNNNALILKQLLEDTISFREQISIEDEKQKERSSVFMRTSEAAIPYAEEMTHSKTWKEIVEKRKAEETLLQDPVNQATYDQLDQVVDLRMFSPDMPLSEAVEELKNAVSPSLKLVVIWRDLEENAGIDRTTPINMDAISGITLRTALGLLLKAVAGGFVELGYTVANGVVTIGPEESLETSLETLAYDVSMLVSKPANYRFNAPTGGSTGSGGGSGGDTFEEQTAQNESERESGTETLLVETQQRQTDLISLIQETIEPDSWYDNGGEGTITFYSGKKLIVRQIRDVHDQIETLLKEMRKSLSEQVSLEARFLTVGENFLEDIGLDVDIFYDFGGRLGVVNFEQGSASLASPIDTGVAGSFGSAVTPATQLTGTYGNIFLNDLQVNFLLRATQAHQDTESLISPKVTVLHGESAAFRVQRTIRYALMPDIQTNDREGGFSGYSSSSNLQQEYGSIVTGTRLNITPIITPDKKHVLLDIEAELRDFLGFERTQIEIPNLGGAANTTGPLIYNAPPLPQTELSRVMTRVIVPDGGTLLLGGQKVSEDIKRQAGTPILSKLPIIGRAFNNKSRVKDQRILLILVKPTIILQDEADSEAIAAIENERY